MRRRLELHPGRPPRTRSGFTLTELLVVIAIIALLLGLLLVAGNGALRAARKNATTRFLASIGQGLEQFNKDHGYYPPLLNENHQNGGSFGSPGSPGADRFAVADEPGASDRWHDPAFAGPQLPREEWPPPDEDTDSRCFNVYALATYLQGVGDINGDGQWVYDDGVASNGPEHSEDDGVDGPGFRTPGPDRSWGGARDRRPHDVGGEHDPAREGRVFGPYVSIGDAGGLEILPLNPDQIFVDADKPYAGMARFIDRWGNPIRYYRDWLVRDPGTGERTMEYVPLEVRDYENASEFLGGGLGNSYSESILRMSPDIAGAPYVLLSVGPDGRSGHRSRTQIQNLYGGSGDTEGTREALEELSDNVRYAP